MSEQVLRLEQYAAMTALIDAGRPRDQVLASAGVSRQAWTAAQTHWLTTMAQQARLERFELQHRFNELLLEQFEAIEAGDPVLSQQGDEGTADDGGEPVRAPQVPEPALAAKPVEPALVVAGPASPVVAPRAVTPRVQASAPQAAAARPAPVVGGAPAVASAASPWTAGGHETAPPPPATTGRRKLTTLMPFAAVAAPVVSRPARAQGDGALPFEPPPLPGAGRPAGGVLGEAAVEPRRSPAAVAERPHVMPFAARPPGPTKKPSVAATLPVDEGAAAPEPLPFATAPFATAPAGGPPPKDRGEPPVHDGALPFADRRPAEPAPATPPVRPTPPPDAGVVKPAPAKPVAAKPVAVDLGSTMHVDGSTVPRFVLPFAGSSDQASPRPEAPVSPGAADGALPFRSQRSGSEPPADEVEDGESLAGTRDVSTARRSQAVKPKLSLEQFASLSAEIGVYPDQRAAIEKRYGLDHDSHDREKGAWALMFLDDEALTQRYTDKLSAFRAWLERKGADA